MFDRTVGPTTLKLGDEVKGKVVNIFAATRNEELNEGRGNRIDNSYHRTKADAMIATHHIDVMGSDGKIAERLALELPDGRIFLIIDEGKPVQIDLNPKAKSNLRKEALGKLSKAEIVALGLGES